MLKIAICDDEEFYRNKISNEIRAIAEKENIDAEISVFEDGKRLIDNMKEVDICFLDIEMESASGIEITQKMNSLGSQKPIIIFVTNYDNYVFKAFELEIFRFIRKERMFELLEQYFLEAVTKYESKRPQYYTISDKSLSIRLLYDDIVYIEKEGKNVVFHTKSNRIYKERNSLKKASDSLDDRFIFLDRCYIGNIFNISAIKGKIAEMVDGTSLTISVTRIQGVKKFIADFWRNKI